MCELVPGPGSVRRANRRTRPRRAGTRNSRYSSDSPSRDGRAASAGRRGEAGRKFLQLADLAGPKSGSGCWSGAVSARLQGVEIHDLVRRYHQSISFPREHIAGSVERAKGSSAGPCGRRREAGAGQRVGTGRSAPPWSVGRRVGVVIKAELSDDRSTSG